MSFLAVSSLFIGSVGFFKATIIYIILGLQPDLRICTALFLLVFSIYSLDKLTDSKEDAVNMPERAAFITRHRRTIYVASVAAYLLSTLIVLLVKPWALPIMLLPMVANAAYGSRVSSHIPRMKDIPVMKNLLVAFIWASLITVLVAWGETDLLGIAFISYFVLAKSFINTVLYDIRDLEGDRENHVRTIPVLLGREWTTILLLALNSTLLCCLLLSPSSWQPIAATLAIYGYIYILAFNKGGNKNALDLCVDGEWMIAFLILLSLRGMHIALPSF